MKKFAHISLLMLILASSLFAKPINYLKKSEVNVFIEKMHKNNGFEKQALEKLFSKVTIQEVPLSYYKKSKKKDFESDGKKGSWDRYSKRFLSSKRVNLALEFIKQNNEVLKKAYKKYGVEPHYITAILGIESYFGKHKGGYLVFDTLATLAFEKNRRNSFFKKELEEFLVFAKKNSLDIKKIKGSFAGAIGAAQFMPSSINSAAIDFNNNKIVSLDEIEDSIGSIANYLSKSGWQKGLKVAIRVSYEGKRFNSLKTGFKYKYNRKELKKIVPKYGRFIYNKKVHLIKLDKEKYDELWYGTKNFYVITRYNRSDYYAMAVHQLALKIKEAYKKQI